MAARIHYQENQQIGNHFFFKDDGFQGRARAAIFYCGFCGNKFRSALVTIRSCKRLSCGCMKEDCTTHSMSHTTEHNTWLGIKNRCYNENAPKYPSYGARGIRVCDEWIVSFESFYAHVGSKPSKIHTLDRINNDGNYEPGNVRWATPKQQARNRRTSRIVDYKGKKITLAELSDLTEIKYATIKHRLNKGMTAEEAIRLPLKNK